MSAIFLKTVNSSIFDLKRELSHIRQALGMSDIDFDEMLTDLLENYRAQFGEF